MKNFSSKKSIQILAHLLKAYHLSDIVISPGSRNAPLAIQFADMEEFHTYSIVDERSAGFVALGMAMATKKPVALTCTSGSAATNYYPAVVEAFYQNIPLLILTADRPKDFVDLFDGQTIRQKNLFHQHSYGDFELLEDGEVNAEDENQKIIKTALELCYEKQGPVHINIPLAEPLYELVSEMPKYPAVEIMKDKNRESVSSTMVADWNLSKRIMILVGTQHLTSDLNAILSQFVKNHSVVVLCEANSNLNHPKFFNHIDRYIYNFSEEDYTMYAPDLLITVGQNVVSKKVKQFLRTVHPLKHWHIDEFWHPDTYFSLTEKVEVKAEVFFTNLLKLIQLEPSSYYNLWDNLRSKKDLLHNQYIANTEFSDFLFFKLFSESIPENWVIHFSNSSAIRYAQLFDFSQHQVYCNRGVSGIDGCTSTAVGFAIKSNLPTVLVTGDLAFFYDINGLWNQYIPPFMRIIIFNNGGGNIFKIIPGPENVNENVLDEFIVTKHHRNAENLAKSFGFSYAKAEDEDTLSRMLENIFKPSPQPKILEVNTSREENAEILKNYFEALK